MALTVFTCTVHTMIARRPCGLTTYTLRLQYLRNTVLVERNHGIPLEVCHSSGTMQYRECWCQFALICSNHVIELRAKWLELCSVILWFYASVS